MQIGSLRWAFKWHRFDARKDTNEVNYLSINIGCPFIGARRETCIGAKEHAVNSIIGGFIKCCADILGRHAAGDPIVRNATVGD